MAATRKIGNASTDGSTTFVYVAAARRRLAVLIDAFWLLAVMLVAGFGLPVTTLNCTHASQYQCELRQGPPLSTNRQLFPLPPFTAVRDLGPGRIGFSAGNVAGVIVEDSLSLDPKLVRAINQMVHNHAGGCRASVGWGRIALVLAIAAAVLAAITALRRSTRVVLTVDSGSDELRVRRSRWGGGNTQYSLSRIRDVRVENEPKGKHSRVVLLFKDNTTTPLFPLHTPGEHHRPFAEKLRTAIRSVV